MDPQSYLVTYHNSEIMPDIRCCMNLGCSVQMFSPETYTDWNCPQCGDVSFWKVADLQYVRDKV